MRATALPGNMYFLGGGGQIKTRILGEQVTQLFGGGVRHIPLVRERRVSWVGLMEALHVGLEQTYKTLRDVRFAQCLNCREIAANRSGLRGCNSQCKYSGVQSESVPPVASISPNLKWKSGATSPPFWALVPPIFDSTFPLHFGLLSSLGKKFCQGYRLPSEIKGKVKKQGQSLVEAVDWKVKNRGELC